MNSSTSSGQSTLAFPTTAALHGSALRERLSYALMAALALLLAVAAVVTYHYSLPQLRGFPLGHVSDFPLGGDPVFINTPEGGLLPESFPRQRHGFPG